MKEKVVITLLIAALLIGTGILLNVRYHFIGDKNAVTEKQELYYCPMHPNFTSDKPRDCSICGMSLVKRETVEGPSAGHVQKERKILYYRNPMNPEITSPVPMKDQMGMDYVPVYEEGLQQETAVFISPARQQLIGVKTQKIQIRKLAGQILTVGIVSYDPNLFIAQQEYLQSLKGRKILTDPNFAYLSKQPDDLVTAIKRKLLLMGMSEEEIKELEKAGVPDQTLYLPQQEKVWVYLTVYEYQAKFVKSGQQVEIQSPAFPGRIFQGEIISIGPKLDPMTRSLKVRALVNNPENKLKLEMYVNAAVKYDLGEKLAVPEDAVMRTGTRDIVYVVEPENHFKPRNIVIGAKTDGYYEVLDGLKENEIIVTSGNFLIDSESKINAVLTQMSDENQ